MAEEATQELLMVGCIYGQYSSLDEFSYDVIRYVGMTGTLKPNKSAIRIAQERLKVHLAETDEGTHNPEKIEWYRSVCASGGEILIIVLAETYEITRHDLGQMEREWIAKLGGPVRPDGTVVQLLNRTHGGDGGWGTSRSDEWIEAARQRMVERYATEESRQIHSEKMKRIWAERPELRENQQVLQREIQNRPERLEQNRQQSRKIWEDPDYRAKQEIEKPCEFCGQMCQSFRGYGQHVAHCTENPDRRQEIPCPMGCGQEIFEWNVSRHLRWCTNNPEADGEPYGPREKIECPECGQECGEGAGLRAHIKWNHDQPIIREPKDDLSTARKKMWANFTPEEREVRIAKSVSALRNQKTWACDECGLETNAGPMVSHHRFSGHTGKTLVSSE